MNGPEHYREGERQARLAERREGDDALVAATLAQAHFTAALAAATALQVAVPEAGIPAGYGETTYTDWFEVAG